jgi:hypothetical protein
MKLDTLTPKGVFRDLISMSWSLKYFLNKGKDYDKIIKYIIDKNLCEIDSIPSIKEVLLDLGISYSSFSRQILKLYEDIRIDEEFQFEKPSVIYNFNLSYNKKRLTISFKDLPVIPRIGETVHVPFFEEYTKYSYFYVKKISHRFYNGIQSVVIQLEEGSYNLFWHFRRDEAFLKNQLSHFHSYKFSEDELKEKLGFIPF